MTIIYVLCPDTPSLERARARYTHTIFRPIEIPQTPYLESVMYTDHLMTLIDEWRDHDWVGCIAHTAHLKQPRVDDIPKILDDAGQHDRDFCAFLYRGDPLVQTAERWHPGFLDAWRSIWNLQDEFNIDASDRATRSFYCNYWATTPQKMMDYCRQMHALKQRIESDSTLHDLLWRDSSYHKRGEDIASIPVEKRRDLWGVEYYPLLPFVMERIPCFYFSLCTDTKFALLR